MNILQGEVRLKIEGQDEFKCLPLWRTSDGSFYLTRKDEVVFSDGHPFKVTSVEWRYSGRELAYVVVLAEEMTETDNKKSCGCGHETEELEIGTGKLLRTHICMLGPDHVLKYGLTTHECACGITWS